MSDDGVALLRLGELGGEIAAGAIVIVVFGQVFVIVELIAPGTTCLQD
jgi:hypothetical protein